MVKNDTWKFQRQIKTLVPASITLLLFSIWQSPSVHLPLEGEAITSWTKKKRKRSRIS